MDTISKQPGKRGFTGMHGNHKKGNKVDRVELICKQCGVSFYRLASFLRVHPNTKYCSNKCEGLYKRKPETKTIIKCDECGIEFEKYINRIKINNYCSKECSYKGRMVEGAKWRDKEQIKKYMQEYAEKNRDTLNKKSLERVHKNHERRLEVQAKYRATHKDVIRVIHTRRYHAKLEGDLTPEQWKSIKEKHGFACNMCGLKEPEITLTLDHIVPISKGGEHTALNIQPLCKSCNSSKGNRLTKVFET
jgi:5-methylcytosine-specific restriction endonuclease McrA